MRKRWVLTGDRNKYPTNEIYTEKRGLSGMQLLFHEMKVELNFNFLCILNRKFVMQIK